MPVGRSRRLLTSSAVRRADHYATLEVNPNASKNDIKKSFYALSRKFHPDAPSTGDMTLEARTARFQALSESYAVLSDDVERRKYDATRRSSRSADPGYAYSPRNEPGSMSWSSSEATWRNEERRRSANYAWQHPARKSGPSASSSARMRQDPFTAQSRDMFASHFEAFAARDRRRTNASAAAGRAGPGPSTPNFDHEAEERLRNESSVFRTGQFVAIFSAIFLIVSSFTGKGKDKDTR